MFKRLINKVTRSVNSAKKSIYAAEDFGIEAEDFSRGAIRTCEALVDAGHEAYIVGGCVRDLLLEETPKDFDVATSATPEQVQRVFPRSRIIGRRFKIVHVRQGREIIEVTTFRGGHNDTKTSHRHAQTNQKGMLVKDNVFGSLEDDAFRRDFTVNALYYDAINNDIIDFTNGVRDIERNRLQIIGDPDTRFREDPVRMLRAIRFQAKLGLELDKNSLKTLYKQAELIREVSGARLFDEVIKVLLQGSAPQSYALLVDTGLFKAMFPASAECMERSPNAKRLLECAMEATAKRISAHKRVSPFYLYACLLWPAVEEGYIQRLAKDLPANIAMEHAANDVLIAQQAYVQIPKRFSLSMRDTWGLQPKLAMRQGNRAQRTLQHMRFRAAYDFLLLREAAGEELGELGQWWTDYQEANPEQQQQMSNAVTHKKRPGNHRRRRPRRKTNQRTSKDQPS